MLYPKIANVKKSRDIINFLIIISISLSLLVMFINFIINLKFDWSIVVVASIIYLWFTVLYALDKSVNLASYVLFQLIGGSILIFVIDYVFGFKKWSLSIGIPIVIMVTNITMVVITIIKYKKYMKYAFYEILILLFSIIYDIIISLATEHIPLLNIITLWICITNLSFVLIFNYDIIKLELEKKFHV